MYNIVCNPKLRGKVSQIVSRPAGFTFTKYQIGAGREERAGGRQKRTSKDIAEESGRAKQNEKPLTVWGGPS